LKFCFSLSNQAEKLHDPLHYSFSSSFKLFHQKLKTKFKENNLLNERFIKKVCQSQRAQKQKQLQFVAVVVVVVVTAVAVNVAVAVAVFVVVVVVVTAVAVAAVEVVVDVFKNL
jgi:hypothetical protein